MVLVFSMKLEGWVLFRLSSLLTAFGEVAKKLSAGRNSTRCVTKAKLTKDDGMNNKETRSEYEKVGE